MSVCSEALTQRTSEITVARGGHTASLVAGKTAYHMVLHGRISFKARFIFNEEVG